MKTFVRAVIGSLRFVVFHVLLLLRPLVRIVAMLVVMPSLLAGIFYGFTRGWFSAPALPLLCAALTMSVLAYLFDTLVLLVSDDDLTLFH
jgi:hypothetical protein